MEKRRLLQLTMHLIFFNLGYTEEQKTFNISVSFPGNSQVSFESPTFYRLDTQALTEAIQRLKNNL